MNLVLLTIKHIEHEIQRKEYEIQELKADLTMLRKLSTAGCEKCSTTNIK